MHTLLSPFSLFLDPFFWFVEPHRMSGPTPSPPVSVPAPITHRHKDFGVFVPSAAAQRARQMLVMLHGAGQDPDDFAAGTTMNEAAERHGFVVLYPRQPSHANAHRCWNWFDPAHQERTGGEPARIATLTRQVAGEHGVEAGRIFVAGLSAGGAMASLLGELFPELFAAVGVHSGLAPRAGRDLSSALAAMQGADRAATVPSRVPTIVFHGDKDTIVSPVNGMHVMTAAMGTSCVPRTAMQTGEDGRRVTRRQYLVEGSRVRGEHWTLHGAAHAWSGGSRRGSFADPQGPNASEEMLRFFKTVQSEHIAE